MNGRGRLGGDLLGEAGVDLSRPKASELTPAQAETTPPIASYALRGIEGGENEGDLGRIPARTFDDRDDAPTGIADETHRPDGALAHNETPRSHPGPRTAVMPDDMRRALIEHARREAPNEMCGVIAGTANPADGGTATIWYPARNELDSPFRYSIHPEDKLRIFLTIDDAAEAFWAIVHSHVRSPAVPSTTDIGLAQWPESLYVLVSLSDAEVDPVTGEASVRAWRIVDGQVHEVALERDK
jgi:proteasome lid subunit RPN8/RPN11